MTKPNLSALFDHVIEDLRVSLETNSYPETFQQDPHAFIAIGQIWNQVCLNLLKTAHSHPEYKNLSVELRHLVEEELAEVDESLFQWGVEQLIADFGQADTYKPTLPDYHQFIDDTSTPIEILRAYRRIDAWSDNIALRLNRHTFTTTDDEFLTNRFQELEPKRLERIEDGEIFDEFLEHEVGA